jgi:protein FAM50
MVEVVYSYWDGTGHRKAMEVRKGCTMEQFLSFVKVQLGEDFPELRNISPADMLYVKEDMIIPHVGSPPLLAP